MKCLVTKLQGVVSDNSIARLGEMFFGKSAETTYAFFQSKKDRQLTLTAISGSFIVNGSTSQSVSIGEEGLGFLINPNTSISLMSKYDIDVIQECLLPFNINDLRYNDFSPLSGTVKYAFNGGDFSIITELVKNCNDVNLEWYDGKYQNLEKISELRCESLSIYRRTGDATILLSDIIQNRNLKVLMAYGNINGGMLIGDIASLSNNTALTNLSIASNKDGIYGDVASLSKLINCKNFSCESNPRIEGNLNSLIEGLRSNGARGEVYFDFSGTKVTYNGNIITAPLTISFVE